MGWQDTNMASITYVFWWKLNIAIKDSPSDEVRLQRVAALSRFPPALLPQCTKLPVAVRCSTPPSRAPSFNSPPTKLLGIWEK